MEQGLARVIGVDGEPDRRVDGLDDAALLEIHRSLVLLRTYDERSVVYHSQGRIGTYAIYRGHEAIQAGLVHALERRDWIFPSYRDSAIGLLRGLPAATILQWWRGHPSGWWNPEDVNVASICVPIATQLPAGRRLRLGLAKIKGDDVVVVRPSSATEAPPRATFTSAMNFAAVGKVPFVLIICQNNQWAISVLLEAPRRRASGASRSRRSPTACRGSASTETTSSRSFKTVREAHERARKGEGPTLVELATYRRRRPFVLR